MRNELMQVEKALKETTRLSFLFHKKTEVEKMVLLLEDAEQKINDEFQALNTDLDRHKKLLKKEKGNIADLEDELDEVESRLEEMQKKLRSTQDSLDESEWDRVRLSEENVEQSKVIEELENKLEDEQAQTELRNKIVSALISAKNENKGLVEFEKCLHEDFLPFAAKESSLANEAEALLKLQRIADELKIVSGIPEFHTAKIIAVAGGFSAGKSEFISSLFDDGEIKLPRSIEPTTAIPTYVINSKNHQSNQLIGLNNNNGVVNLSEIDPNLIGKLNHGFIKSFNFKLKELMPYMFLTTKIKYNHICFVDTPGYNPSSDKGSHTADDAQIAQEFVANADALIWVIGADVNGTILRDDINFLKKAWDNRKPLYFVLNKADLRPEQANQDVIKTFQAVLKKEKISYQGISAYTSTERKELMSLKGKLKLNTFLERMDETTDKKAELLRSLYEVDEMYQHAILKEIKEFRMLRNAIDDISLDLDAAGFQDSSYIHDRIADIVRYFNTKEHEKHLKELEEVVKKLRMAIEKALGGKPSSIKRPVVDAKQIQIKELSENLNGFLENDESDEDLPPPPPTQNSVKEGVKRNHTNLWGVFVRPGPLK